MMVRQCELRKGGLEMTCWLEDKPLKVGQFVTLKGVEGRWEVTVIHDPAVDKQNIYHTWNNNI